MKKTEKKQILELLEEAQNYLDKYDYDECIWNLFEISNKFYEFEDITQDFMDEDTATEFLKHELEDGGLVRLYYAMWDVKPFWNEYVRMNAYWNLEEIKKEDLQYCIDEIKDRIKNN